MTDQTLAAAVDEIEAGIYRLSTIVPMGEGTFTFNQYLVAADRPLLYHSGPRRLFPVVRQALELRRQLPRMGVVVHRLPHRLARPEHGALGQREAAAEQDQRAPRHRACGAPVEQRRRAGPSGRHHEQEDGAGERDFRVADPPAG
jgi:hypothetical protein